MSEELGRVVDPNELDDAPGSRGRIAITVPRDWAEEGGSIVFTAPTRITCARCDGGGCDLCGRSGALRAPEDISRRALHIQIARAERDAYVIRLVNPFGEGAGIDQLYVEVTLGEASSSDVTRVESPPAVARIRPRSIGFIGIAIALLVVAILELASRH